MSSAALLICGLSSGCIAFIVPTQMARVHTDFNSYSAWSMQFDEFDHYPLRRYRVRQMRHLYNVGPVPGVPGSGPISSAKYGIDYQLNPYSTRDRTGQLAVGNGIMPITPAPGISELDSSSGSPAMMFPPNTLSAPDTMSAPPAQPIPQSAPPRFKEREDLPPPPANGSSGGPARDLLDEAAPIENLLDDILRSPNGTQPTPGTSSGPSAKRHGGGRVRQAGYEARGANAKGQKPARSWLFSK